MVQLTGGYFPKVDGLKTAVFKPGKLAEPIFPASEVNVRYEVIPSKILATKVLKECLRGRVNGAANPGS